MSFLDDIGSALGGAVDWLTGSKGGSVLLNLGGTALAALTLKKVTNSIAADNVAPETATNNGSTSSGATDDSGTISGSAGFPDPGVRLQLSPSTENKIPVVYGTALLSGKITDAQLAVDNQTMAICVAICEQTGKLELGAGADSEIKFKEIYWNDSKLLFQADGISVLGAVDSTGAVDASMAGLIRIWLFSGSSENPVLLTTSEANPELIPAYQVMPNWDNTWMMPGLVFAIIGITYSRVAGLTNIGNFKFHVENTMTQPGDCLYDFMTNTRYGAGLVPSEIYSQ